MLGAASSATYGRRPRPEVVNIAAAPPVREELLKCFAPGE
jgi:hypothetical protein